MHPTSAFLSSKPAAFCAPRTLPSPPSPFPKLQSCCSLPPRPSSNFAIWGREGGGERPPPRPRPPSSPPPCPRGQEKGAGAGERGIGPHSLGGRGKLAFALSSIARGFEPLWAKPSGFLVRRLGAACYLLLPPHSSMAQGLCNRSKCRDPGSNRRPSDLQSDALPAEL